MGGVRPRLLTRAPSIDRALPRPRLLNRVGTARVVSVAGPEGSGTSTLAAQIGALTPSMAWCRLAPGFDRFGDVVEMVASTLGTDVTASASVLGAADQLLDMFEAQPLTVVIDDHHLAADGDIDRMVGELAALVPPDGRIVLAGAVRPAGLIGLVPRGTLQLIGATDLAFTAEEGADLFARTGAPAERAATWVDQFAGWAQGVAAGAHAPDSSPDGTVAVLLGRLIEDQPDARPLLDAATVLPYVSDLLLEQLPDAADGLRLHPLVDATPLFVDHGEFVRLLDAARRAHAPSIDATRARTIGRTAGAVLADIDPTTAIEVFLDIDEPELAAEVLADHLTEIGVERALTWLYRLPPELRRRFPPVLAAGQATVEVDSALAAAEVRVETASTERSRREALFALGSIERHRGELAAAAGAFESALRAASDDADTAARISAELATTRWLLGDRLGARSALDDAPSSGETTWLRTQLDVVEGAAVAPAAGSTPSGDPFTDAATALAAIACGDASQAERFSEAAYLAAVSGGGEPFLAAAVVQAWRLLRDGAGDEALTTAEELERRLGPRHELGRIHGAIIRERISRHGADRGRHERDERRLRDLRRRGYASVEELASAVLDIDAPDTVDAGVVVNVLGAHTATVDERTIGRSDWKSKKAFEVLTVLATHAAAGARREQIIEAVWPGRPPEKGRTLLRTALSEIRKVVEPSRPTGEPSRFVSTNEDLIALEGALDLDLVERTLADDPADAFARLRRGLAPEVVATEWAADWPARVERLLIAAASQISDDAEATIRVQALDALIDAEPWQRTHYDDLAALYRSIGDDVSAADVERRWFADD